MTRRQDLEAELDALYARVPRIACKGLCADNCGPIDHGPVETRRMAQAGVKVPQARDVLDQVKRGQTTDVMCPALEDGQCGIYESRPMICRIWYADRERPCPHGCRPIDGAKYLTYAEARHLVDSALTLGTSREPLSLERIEALLADPAVRQRIRQHVEKSLPWSIRHEVEW